MVHVRYRMRQTVGFWLAAALGSMGAALIWATNPSASIVLAGGLYAALVVMWWRGSIMASRIAQTVDDAAEELGLARSQQDIA